MKRGLMKAAAVSLGIVLGMGLKFGGVLDHEASTVFMPLELGISEAQARGGRYAGRRAGRRVARRGVARRTTRRVIRRHSIAGCARWRTGYYNCGGVYYQRAVESGKTVYVVVYP